MVHYPTSAPTFFKSANNKDTNDRSVELGSLLAWLKKVRPDIYNQLEPLATNFANHGRILEIISSVASDLEQWSQVSRARACRMQWAEKAQACFDPT
jgi:hypothetical protein